jgi:HlyD family secretion protein
VTPPDGSPRLQRARLLNERVRGAARGLFGVLALLACAAGDPNLSLVGSVERTLVEVAAPASEVITEIAVERGDPVEPGQLLVRLDPTLADAEIARCQARLAGAQTSVIIAQHELERAQDLRGARISSQQALERAQLGRSEAYARLREAEAEVAVARKRRADLDLAAPMSGVVDQIPFDQGERVPAGAVLAVLLAGGDPWVRVWIPEARLVGVRPGTEAEIRVDGVGAVLRGQVLDVAREPEFTPHYALTERDRGHLVFEARIAIRDAPDSLRPGLPADVLVRVDDSGLAPP